MRAGQRTKYVTLSRSPQTTPDSDGFFEDLTPSGTWAALQPIGNVGDGRTQAFAINIRFHPQVTVDTRIVYSDPVLGRDRAFFVRDVQNVNEANVEMNLTCDEVQP